MKTIYPCLFAVLFFLACGPTAPEEKPAPPSSTEMAEKQIKVKTPLEIGMMNSPESVTFDGKHYYISNVGGPPDQKDGNGFISRVDQAGEIISLRYMIDLDAPKGMSIIGNHLYVADIDRIKGYSLTNGLPIFNLSLADSGVQFLNDLTAKDDQTLYVSATDQGVIYEVNISGKGSFKELTIEGNLDGVNGLEYDRANQYLYTASFGSSGKANGPIGFIKIAETPLRFEKIGDYTGYLDGIFKINKKLLVSDWNDISNKAPESGKLVLIDIESGASSEVKLSATIAGPADFYYNKKTQQAWIPKMLEGKILIEDIVE